MPLQFMVDDVNVVPEQHRSLYSLNDADKKYYLQVEGVVAKDKLEEFRTNNINLMKEVDKFKGVDLQKWNNFLDLEAKGKLAGKTPAEVDAIIAERITPMKNEYEGKISELAKNNETLTGQLSHLLVDNVIRDAGSKAGITGAAMDDLILRGKSTFKLVDGSPVPHDAKGNVVYGKDAVTPLTINDWIAKLRTDAPHLFPQSQGGGAPGSRAPGAISGNLTANQKIAEGLRQKASR